jgi:hypothetical protein
VGGEVALNSGSDFMGDEAIHIRRVSVEMSITILDLTPILGCIVECLM